MRKIANRQNDANIVRFLAAARAFYNRAQWWHRLRVVGTTAFGVVGVLIVIFDEDAAAYVGAAAGAWILVARTMFNWLERSAFDRGARAQEQFDTALFELPWNASIAGNRISDEDIADAVRRVGLNSVRDWYPARADALPWPRNVAVCQRASAAWGRGRTAPTPYSSPAQRSGGCWSRSQLDSPSTYHSATTWSACSSLRNRL